MHGQRAGAKATAAATDGSSEAFHPFFDTDAAVLCLSHPRMRGWERIHRLLMNMHNGKRDTH